MAYDPRPRSEIAAELETVKQQLGQYQEAVVKQANRAEKHKARARDLAAKLEKLQPAKPAAAAPKPAAPTPTRPSTPARPAAAASAPTPTLISGKEFSRQALRENGQAYQAQIAAAMKAGEAIRWVP